MNNADLLLVSLFLKLRDFYRRNKPIVLLVLLIVGVFVVSILMSRDRQNVSESLSVEPEWSDWHPAS